MVVLHVQSGIVMAPAVFLNGLALISALCGSWLLAATQWRQIHASRRLAVAQAAGVSRDTADNATWRVNRVFYWFGWTGLVLGLGLSAISTLI